LPRIIKFLLFLIIFGIVFELGLFSSYTIVTAQPPDVGKLIDMQVSKLTAIWNSISGSDKAHTVKTVNVTNQEDVGKVLQSKTGLSGIDLSTLGAIFTGTSSDTVNITLIAQGYKENQTGSVASNSTGSSSGQIVINEIAKYSINATAMAKVQSKGVEVDTSSIQITSVTQIQ
jgi:hypothetical protein